jgi:hypothetical protein
MVDGMFMRCHWSAQAEIGIGALIATLGTALMIFSSPKIRLELTIRIFLSDILTMLIPYAIIGGCAMHSMACRKITFRAITVISILLLITGAANSLYLTRKKPAP